MQNKCTLISPPLQPISLSQPRAFWGERKIPSPEGGFLPPLFFARKKGEWMHQSIGGGSTMGMIFPEINWQLQKISFTKRTFGGRFLGLLED